MTRPQTSSAQMIITSSAMARIDQNGYLGNEKEVRHGAEDGDDDGDDSGPGLAEQQADPRRDDDDAEDQMNPPPCRNVDLEGVVRRNDIELVFDEPGKPGEETPHAGQEQECPGKGCEPHNGSAVGVRAALRYSVVVFRSRVILPFHLTAPDHPGLPRRASPWDRLPGR